MKESFWGLAVVGMGIFSIFFIYFFQSITSTDEHNYHLLKETTAYITDSFLSYFSVDKNNLHLNFKNIDLKELFFITPEYILPYLTYIKENRKIFRTAIRHLDSLNFNTVYERMFNFLFDPILERFDFPESERKYVIKFYLTGVTAIAMEWLNNDCQDSIETISGIISKCIINERNIP